MAVSKTMSVDPEAAIKRVDWRLLEYFRVAGMRQHITRAAEQLGTSQPSLSRALAQLEADMGVPLFQRSGRSVCLTRYGQAFLDHVERAFQAIEDGRREIADLTNPGRGSISIGFLRSLGAEYVPSIVRQFRKKHPDVRFNFTSCNSLELTEKLQHGELDLIFMSAPEGTPSFAWRQLTDQELVLIVSDAHPLADREWIALNDVAGEPFVTFKPGHAVRNLTQEVCRRAGFTPRVVLEGDDSSVMRGFVSAGFGVAIAPPDNSMGPGVVALRISEPTPRRAIGMAWRMDRYLPALVRLFRDFATSTKFSPNLPKPGLRQTTAP